MYGLRYLLFTFIIGSSFHCFSQVAVQKNTFVYGESDGANLLMDVYMIPNSLPERPVFLLVHGGGFAGGSRKDPFIVDYMNFISELGYIAVSIDYTLWMQQTGFGCDVAAEEKIETFLKSGREVNMATAFLLEKSKELGIDADKIVLAGSSAGAEAILHAAFWNETRFTIQGNEILPLDFLYRGAVNMAGALHNIDFITRENAIPVLSYHGTCDPLVPYDVAPHHFCDEKKVGYLMLYGSRAIHQRLRTFDRSSILFSACEDAHEWADDPLKKFHPLIPRFLGEVTSPGTLLLSEDIGNCKTDIPCK